MDDKAFLGSGLKFPLQVDPRTGRIAMSVHEEDISEAIRIIIGTHKGERVMRPDYGSTAADYVFAASGDSLRSRIAYDLKEQLTLQEPRIRDVVVTCREQSGVLGIIEVEIEYIVRSTNNRYNKVYPFSVEEGTAL